MSSFVALAEENAPNAPRCSAKRSATSSSASSQLAGSSRPARRISGIVRRSGWFTKVVPKRPLTQSSPPDERLSGSSSTPVIRPSASAVIRMPQPTPQYGQTVETVRPSAASRFGVSASVGQAATQEPQEVQVDSPSGSSAKAAIRAACPEPAMPIAPMCCRSVQADTQRPQRMQSDASKS